MVSIYRLNRLVQLDLSAHKLIADGSHSMNLYTLEAVLAVFCLCVPVVRPLWGKLRARLRAQTGQSQENLHGNNVRQSISEVKDRCSFAWTNFLTQDNRTQYEVAIRAGTPTASTTNLNKYDTHENNSTNGVLGGSSEVIQATKPLRINVKKEWRISHETATTSH